MANTYSTVECVTLVLAALPVGTVFSLIALVLWGANERAHHALTGSDVDRHHGVHRRRRDVQCRSRALAVPEAAMTPDLMPFTIGVGVGAVVATVITGIAAMERPRFFIVCARLPERIYRQIALEAEHNHRTVAREVISRLRTSIDRAASS